MSGINYGIYSDLRHLISNQNGIDLWIKRDDLIHPLYGGNKFRKLKYNLEYARENNFDTLLTFGGAYSNHIAATAFAGKYYGFKTIGIIRGNELIPDSVNAQLNKTLRLAVENGMQLKFISREDYKRIYDDDFWNELKSEFGNLFIIPEGGANELGWKGCKEITGEIEIDFDYICCPVGTGTTLLGLNAALKPHQKALGIEVYRNQNPCFKNLQYFKKNETINLSHEPEILNYSFGGYGKQTAVLNNFCTNFYNSYHICIEPFYTGKMFYGIFDLAHKGYFAKGTVVVAVHTGGLQYLPEFA